LGPSTGAVELIGVLRKLCDLLPGRKGKACREDARKEKERDGFFHGKALSIKNFKRATPIIDIAYRSTFLKDFSEGKYGTSD